VRLKAQGQLEYEPWQHHRLDGLEVVYLKANELYMKVCLEDTKAVLFAIIGGLADGRKVVLAEES